MSKNIFRLEIRNTDKDLIELVVESDKNMPKEEIGEVLLTAFKELEQKNELLLRLILFSSLESLSNSKDIMLVIKQYLDEYHSIN